MSANDRGGEHYKRLPIEPWDFIIANKLGWCEGNAIKYISRWREKGGIDDIRKAIHYLEKLIEVETADVHESQHPSWLEPVKFGVDWASVDA